MKQIKQKIVLLTSIVLIGGCVTENSKLTTALSDGVQAGVKASTDKNSSKKGENLSANLKRGAISGVQVGLKSALDDNSSKDKNSSGNMTTKVIDGVANYLQDDKDKKK